METLAIKPGGQCSLWLATTLETNYPSLKDNIKC